VAAAAIMKVTTATAERRESRANPQTPCPDVQPDPTAVPSPTSSPAIVMPRRLSDTVCATGVPKSATTSGAAKSPRTKVTRQPASRGASFEGRTRLSAPRVIPEIPAMRPKSAITMTALSPIRMPPKSDIQGVKSVGETGPMKR